MSPRGVSNVRDYGARGDGTDATDAIEKAMRLGGTVYLPAGTYLLSRPLSVPDGTQVRGDGVTSVLQFAGTEAGIRVGDGLTPHSGGIVRDIRLEGHGDVALWVSHAWLLLVDGISIGGHWRVGFQLQSTWGSTFSNLRTAGADISYACFLVGSEFNANLALNWYTSNFSRYNILIDTRVGNGGHSHGNAFSMMTAQGGRFGLYVRAHSDSSISGLYTENVVHPLTLGDSSGRGLAIGLAISGASLGGPFPSHPDYRHRLAAVELDWAASVSLAGVNFTGTYNVQASAPVAFSGGGGGFGAIAVARVTPEGRVHSFEVLDGGAGYLVPPEVIVLGEGSGAAGLARIAEGRVVSVALTAAGIHYLAPPLPVAVRFNRSTNVTFTGAFINSGRGFESSLYPWIVRHPEALQDSGVRVIGDVRLSRGAVRPVDLVKWRGHEHLLVGHDDAGHSDSSAYRPPVFPSTARD